MCSFALLPFVIRHDKLAESEDPYNILRSMLTDEVLNKVNNNEVVLML